MPQNAEIVTDLNHGQVDFESLSPDIQRKMTNRRDSAVLARLHKFETMIKEKEAEVKQKPWVAKKT